MKVLLLNGSPREFGCTYTALTEVAGALNANDVETEIMWIGRDSFSGVYEYGSLIDEFAAKLDDIDGLVIGSPVYYAASSGAISMFLDKAFYTNGGKLRGKVGASVVSCRRGGASAAFDELNKYFTINSMPVVSSQYWNQVHGNTPDEVRQDLEGLQTMRTLGKNMAWLIKCIELGKKNGVEIPPQEKKTSTNFIR
ncbi:MAG: flavodoxin family protein [Clostridia bacterium]|nr:flavodoxin family protein [Clostridia bacterium]MBQ9598680.1 flavodoxin family protein [Clostridia bacterium]